MRTRFYSKEVQDEVASRIYEKLQDDETGEWFDFEKAACKCSVCGAQIWKNDKCYVIPTPAFKTPLVICKDCLAWDMTYTGEEAACEIAAARKENKEKEN